MTDPIHPRQRARAKVMAFVLAGFAILFFAITIVKMKNGHHQPPGVSGRK